MVALREDFVGKMQQVLAAWIEEHDRVPTPEESFKMMIDAGMEDGVRAELEEAMRRYMATLPPYDHDNDNQKGNA